MRVRVRVRAKMTKNRASVSVRVRARAKMTKNRAYP